jgi:hypothetical protein
LILGLSGQQTPQQPALQHEVSVTLKLIQVYVTDKSGKPVRDLTKDEFRLTDNGKPVTISAFERHDLAAAPTAGVEAPAPEPAAVLVPVLDLVLAIVLVIGIEERQGSVGDGERRKGTIHGRVHPSSDAI